MSSDESVSNASDHADEQKAEGDDTDGNHTREKGIRNKVFQK